MSHQEAQAGVRVRHHNAAHAQRALRVRPSPQVRVYVRADAAAAAACVAPTRAAADAAAVTTAAATRAAGPILAENRAAVRRGCEKSRVRVVHGVIVLGAVRPRRAVHDDAGERHGRAVSLSVARSLARLSVFCGPSHAARGSRAATSRSYPSYPSGEPALAAPRPRGAAGAQRCSGLSRLLTCRRQRAQRMRPYAAHSARKCHTPAAHAFKIG
mmetsp:Transcript_18786/g.66364  ORF Transcript_18786/g.66364 Transcript_18786/m.66364 type:complete len:214 (-) Transcript_18786:74-715(-)